jgi:hypothetical protein
VRNFSDKPSLGIIYLLNWINYPKTKNLCNNGHLLSYMVSVSHEFWSSFAKWSDSGCLMKQLSNVGQDCSNHRHNQGCGISFLDDYLTWLLAGGPGSLLRESSHRAAWHGVLGSWLLSKTNDPREWAWGSYKAILDVTHHHVYHIRFPRSESLYSVNTQGKGELGIIKDLVDIF